MNKRGKGRCALRGRDRRGQTRHVRPWIGHGWQAEHQRQQKNTEKAQHYTPPPRSGFKVSYYLHLRPCIQRDPNHDSAGLLHGSARNTVKWVHPGSFGVSGSRATPTAGPGSCRSKGRAD